MIMYAEFADEISKLLLYLNRLTADAIKRCEDLADTDGGLRPYITSGRIEVALEGEVVGELWMEEEWWVFDDLTKAPPIVPVSQAAPK